MEVKNEEETDLDRTKGSPTIRHAPPHPLSASHICLYMSSNVDLPVWRVFKKTHAKACMLLLTWLPACDLCQAEHLAHKCCILAYLK